MLVRVLNKQATNALRKGLTTSSMRCVTVTKDYLKPTSRHFASALPAEDNLDLHPSIMKEKFKVRLQKEREQALVGGGLKRIEKQHAKGQLSARERIELLFDKGTLGFGYSIRDGCI